MAVDLQNPDQMRLDLTAFSEELATTVGYCITVTMMAALDVAT